MQPTLSTKALLLKALYKEALRKQEPRAVTQQTEARRARLLLHSGYEPSRAFGRLRDLLLELDVRSAWHFGKANAKKQLRDAYEAVEQRYAARVASRRPSSSTSTAVAATPEELAPLYGKDGLLRVRCISAARQDVWCSASCMSHTCMHCTWVLPWLAHTMPPAQTLSCTCMLQWDRQSSHWSHRATSSPVHRPCHPADIPAVCASARQPRAHAHAQQHPCGGRSSPSSSTAAPAWHCPHHGVQSRGLHGRPTGGVSHRAARALCRCQQAQVGASYTVTS